MRDVMAGLNGWMRMQRTVSSEIRLVDTALTVVATLLVAVTWAMLQH